MRIFHSFLHQPDPMVETPVVANEYRGERGRHMPPSSKQAQNGRPLNSFYDQSPFESHSSKTQMAKPASMMGPTPDLVKGTMQCESSI